MEEKEKKFEKKLDNMIPDEKIEKMYDEFNGVNKKNNKKHKGFVREIEDAIKNIKDLLEKLKMQSLKMTF